MSRGFGKVCWYLSFCPFFPLNRLPTSFDPILYLLTPAQNFEPSLRQYRTYHYSKYTYAKPWTDAVLFHSLQPTRPLTNLSISSLRLRFVIRWPVKSQRSRMSRQTSVAVNLRMHMRGSRITGRSTNMELWSWERECGAKRGEDLRHACTRAVASINFSDSKEISMY